MTTKVSICSQALLMLGQKPIASFSEPSTGATLASNLYTSEKEALLREHPWNCCTRRAVLAASATPPAHYYTATFPLPADCVRLLSVGDDDDPVDYRLEKEGIQSDGDALNIRYVANLDESLWDSKLVNLMKLKMRAVFAYPVTKSTSLADLCAAEFNDALKKAKTIDGQEDPPEQLGQSGVLAAREGRA